MSTLQADLRVAFALADLADETTLRWWHRDGVASTTKADGSPVTAADVAAEEAVREALRKTHPGDGFIGEEVGETIGTTARRWIVDGIDGTRYFAAGAPTWGTLIALEERGQIVLGLASSPAQDRRWWATRGNGAFTGRATDASQPPAPLRVSASRVLTPDRVATLPAHEGMAPSDRRAVERLVGGRPANRAWSHQLRVAEGALDACIWFAGDIWDHAAPSIIVEEAGGRFSDHGGGRRLDTRTAVYSSGAEHDRILDALDRRAP